MSLKANHTLISLNLRYNHIGDEGAREIAKVLRESNKTLNSIDLSIALLLLSLIGVNSIGAEVRQLFDPRAELL